MDPSDRDQATAASLAPMLSTITSDLQQVQRQSNSESIACHVSRDSDSALTLRYTVTVAADADTMIARLAAQTD